MMSRMRCHGLWWGGFLVLDYLVFSSVLVLVSVLAGFTNLNFFEAVAESLLSGAPLVIKGVFVPFYIVLLFHVSFLAAGDFWTHRSSTLRAVLGCFFFTYAGFLVVDAWASNVPLSDAWLVISDEFDSWTCLEHDCNGIRVSALLSSVLSALSVHLCFGRLIGFLGRRSKA